MKKKQTLFFTMQLLGKKYVGSFHFSGEKYQQMEIWTTGFLNFQELESKNTNVNLGKNRE